MQRNVLHLVAGQSSAEPASAIRQVVRNVLKNEGSVSLYRGMSLIDAEELTSSDRLRVQSTGLLGSNIDFWKQGRLDVIPERVSIIPRFLRDGVIPNDITLLRARKTSTGFTPGIVSDYLPAAFETAGTVIVQEDESIPILDGAPEVSFDRVSQIIHDQTSLIPQLRGGVSTNEDSAIAENVASIVQDGDCIQIGIGGLGHAIARALAKHRQDLGIHTGLVNDSILNLIDSNAVTNTFKEEHRGFTVAPIYMGTTDFYSKLAGRRDLLLRPTDYTNDAAVLGRIPRLTAINSAVQVDLLGQVNAEFVGSKRIATVGGQIDFATGASMSEGGKSIVVLRSTAAKGRISRIVPRVEVASVGATFTDFVVTEFGIADLRGKTLEARANSLAAISHPDFRQGLRSPQVL